MSGDEMMYTPDEWAPSTLAEGTHDHKGYSEEKCFRCGWVMGHQPLNCQNDDTPHVFPSQLDEIVRLRALVDDYENGINWHTTCTNCAKLLDDNYDQYCQIERLRAAGDQLADYVREAGPGLHDDMAILACWQEARRG